MLQEREFERLGSTRTITTNVRLIAATNRELNVLVQEGNFRSDLFFRLNVFPIDLPPLRDRQEDIPLLVRHFAEHFSCRMNKTIETISPATMDALCQYPWSGNIRELQNVIERAVILSAGPALVVPLAELKAHTGPQLHRQAPVKPTRRQPVRSILSDVDRDQIIRVLKETDGRVGGPGGAASRLGLKRTTFITRMKALGIDLRRCRAMSKAATTSPTFPTRGTHHQRPSPQAPQNKFLTDKRRQDKRWHLRCGCFFVDATGSAPLHMFDPEITTDNQPFLTELSSVPLGNLIGSTESGYRYGYIGTKDRMMSPLITPGAIVRIDERRTRIASGPWHREFERPIYFLQTRTGYTCCWLYRRGQAHPATAPAFAGARANCIRR